MRAIGLWIGVIAVAGCAGNIGSETAARSWALETDGDLAFHDPAHPEFGTYPNPFELGRLLVVLRPDGTLCATDAEGWERCGGPFDGIPYTARAHLEGDKLCLDVVDVRGNHVQKWCHERLDGDGEASAATDAPLCRAATTAAGDPCSLCTDAEGTITRNTCGGDDSTIDEFGEVLDGSDCTSPDGAVRFGAGIFARTFNDYMDRIGLDLSVDATRFDLDGSTNFDEGEISLDSPDCADVIEYRDDEFEDDLDDPEDDAFGQRAIQECLGEGDCRIGQLVTRAMVEACGQVPAGCNMHRVSMGVIAGGGETAEEVCDGDEGSEEGSSKDGLIEGEGAVEDCVGSPLVLDLAGDGLELRGPADGARFALMGRERMPVGWLAGSDDALVAIDLDGDGAITSGRELFGEATGGWARDGFAALARADSNDDGVVDAFDHSFRDLLAWADDGDGVSEPGELRPLFETGITSLPLEATALGAVDAHGNQLGLEARADTLDGRGVRVIDVWFRLGR